MSSPNPPHSVKVELFISGAWVDISADVYQRDPITITRGRSSESGKIQAGTATLTLDNRAYKYSPRNPTGPYYGQFKRNCSIRISVGTDVRFVGEIAVPRPRSDQSGRDLRTEIEAGGVLRRLGQGQSAVRSNPRNYLTTVSPAPIAYWPLEDGPLSIRGEPLIGTAPFTHLGTVAQNWGEGTLSPWLPPGLEGKVRDAASNDAVFLAAVPAPSACTRWDVAFVVNGRADFTLAVNSGSDPFGTDAWSVSITPSASTIFVVAPAGTSGAGAPINYSYDGEYHHVQFSALENSVGDANFYVIIDGETVHTGNVTGSGASGPVLIAPVTLRFDLNEGGNDTTGVAIEHVAYWFNTGAPSLSPTSAYLNIVRDSRAGEAAGDRISRLCTENTLTLTTVGTASDTQACGPQYPGTALELLQESADVDGGLLYETAGALGLTYRTRKSLYNETVSLALTYTTNHHLGKALDTPEDDQLIRNDVTVTRRLGGTYRAERTTGALGSAAPPTGVGRYDDSVTINCLSQDQAAGHAGWRIHQGTWDEARFPHLDLDLSTLPLAKRTDALTVTIGSRVTIDSPPAWLPPDQIDLLVVGVRETINRFQWLLTFVCVPFGPFRAAVENTARASSDGSTVTTTTTATSWSVATPTGPLWITSAAFASQFPFDLRVVGERVTCTAISGGASPQTFTVIRSVNGVVKAHTSAAVELWQPAYAAM